jgi:hypothetical protein
MPTPDSPGPDDVPSGGRVVPLDDHDFDHLLPKTTFDHPLSEEGRRKAEQHLKEIYGNLDFLSPESDVYPMAYELASDWLASGM